MAHVIVIGAGIGGVPAATPSNPWVAVGWRECEQTRVALQKPLQAKGVQWVAERVERIDAEARRLRLSSGRELDYDYLVIATGPKLAFDEVPGLGHSAFTQSVCTQEHAAQAWQKYQEFIKNPGPIVIGAAAGASCFGPAYELAMIVDADLRKRKLRDRVPMTFVTSEPYIGHMGLGGVGDSKGLMESELRKRHIKWLTNARITRVDSGAMLAVEHDEDGKPKKEHDVPFKYAMVIPAFRGVDAVVAVPGLCNPRGFVSIDAQQRSTKYPNIFSAGVCVAIPPVESTPVPTGAPKTGYMIESMVSALVENIVADIGGKPATAQATWNAVCLADFGDTGAAFVALPEIPPRNVTWAGMGKWVHLAKIAFEQYFLRKVRTGSVTPIYERYVLKALGVVALKERHQ